MTGDQHSCPMFSGDTDAIRLGQLGDLVHYECRHCGIKWSIPYDDDGIKQCPVCDELCKDDVTIEDHGMCYDCHHQILSGERCWYCRELGHSKDECLEYEIEG